MFRILSCFIFILEFQPFFKFQAERSYLGNVFKLFVLSVSENSWLFHYFQTDPKIKERNTFTAFFLLFQATYLVSRENHFPYEEIYF